MMQFCAVAKNLFGNRNDLSVCATFAIQGTLIALFVSLVSASPTVAKTIPATEPYRLPRNWYAEVDAYKYDQLRQYESGQHRGVDVEPTSDLVRSPETGRVVFAGTVAGRNVVVLEPQRRIGGVRAAITFTATSMDVKVRRGDTVGIGSVIGVLGGGKSPNSFHTLGEVHIGIYELSNRSNYLPISVESNQSILPQNFSAIDNPPQGGRTRTIGGITNLVTSSLLDSINGTSSKRTGQAGNMVLANDSTANGLKLKNGDFLEPIVVRGQQMDLFRDSSWSSVRQMEAAASQPVARPSIGFWPITAVFDSSQMREQRSLMEAKDVQRDHSTNTDEFVHDNASGISRKPTHVGYAARYSASRSRAAHQRVVHNDIGKKRKSRRAAHMRIDHTDQSLDVLEKLNAIHQPARTFDMPEMHDAMSIRRKYDTRFAMSKNYLKHMFAGMAEPVRFEGKRNNQGESYAPRLIGALPGAVSDPGRAVRQAGKPAENSVQSRSMVAAVIIALVLVYKLCRRYFKTRSRDSSNYGLPELKALPPGGQRLLLLISATAGDTGAWRRWRQSSDEFLHNNTNLLCEREPSSRARIHHDRRRHTREIPRESGP